MNQAADTLVLFGATSPVALALAERAVAEQLAVVAVVRAGSDASALAAAGATVVRADVMDTGALSAALADVPRGALFLSALGGKPGSDVKVDSTGNCNAIDAAVRCNAARFVLITTVGAGDSRDALPEQLLPILGPIAAEKTLAEAHLRASGLDYTILRPGHLLSEAATGNAMLVEDPRTLGAVTRSDLAALALGVLRADACRNRTFAVADKNALRSTFPVTPFEWSPQAS